LNPGARESRGCRDEHIGSGLPDERGAADVACTEVEGGLRGDFLRPSQAIDQHHPSPPFQKVFEKSWLSTIDVFFNEVFEKAFQFFSVAVSAREHFEALKTTRTEVLRPRLSSANWYP
jgi:hypothetical protein